MTKVKHTWTDKEEATCCYTYLKHSLQDNYPKDYSTILNKLSNQFPDISRNSIKMKLQNIKFLCMQKNIPDSIQIQPLCNASNKNWEFFNLIIMLPEIQELITARQNDLNTNKTVSQPASLDNIRKAVQSFKNKTF